MIILNSLLPIVTLLVAGAVIRKWKLTDAAFIATADRLIYYFFFPVMLFWNIGGAPFGQGITINFCLAVVCPLLGIYCISGLLIRLLPIADFQACAFAQSCYRFNTYIGMAVILSGLGSEAVRYFGVLISFTIPLLNIFAVSTCIWYSGKEIDAGRRLLVVCRSFAGNPLILSCLAGFLYSWLFGSFPRFIHNSLSLISSVSLPLALLSIGGGLSFKGIRNDLPLSFLAAGLKLLLLPILGWISFRFFQVDGLPFKVAMLFFALPTSTVTYVLSGQMNSDTRLASATIVVSTVLSFGSLSVILLM